MAKFNNTNLKKLIKNYHIVSAQLDNSEYTSVKGDRAALEAKFGFQGAEYLTQLDEYINELNAPLAKSSRSIAKVIENGDFERHINRVRRHMRKEKSISSNI